MPAITWNTQLMSKYDVMGVRTGVKLQVMNYKYSKLGAFWQKSCRMSFSEFTGELQAAYDD